MATNTTQYNFQKPEVGADTDAWGDMLNANWDSTDSLLRGATALSNIGIGATNTTIPLVCNAASATDITATFSGKVGIGTTSPQALLHVQDTLGSPQIKINNEGTGSGIASLMFHGGGAGNPTSIIQSGGADSGNVGIIFKHGNNGSETERMRIDSSGNVGIGTTSPYVKTEIIGGDLAVGGGAGASNLGLEIKGVPLSAIPSAQVRGYIATADSGMGVAGDLLIAPRTSVNASVRFITGTSPAERMRIDSSGRVGIGTTNFTSKFHVGGDMTDFVYSEPAGDSIATFAPITTGSSSAMNVNIGSGMYGGAGVETARLNFLNGHGNDGFATGFSIKSYKTASATASDEYLAFEEIRRAGNTGVTYNERMRIDSSGNVGIGTTSPALSGGDAGLVTHISDDTRAALRLTTTGGGGDLELRTFGTNGAQIINAANGELRLGTNSTERMRIDSSGKVGIGIANPANTLTVGGLEPSAIFADATVGIKCDTNHKGILLQENSGAEQWSIGVGEAGSLKFYDSDSATPAVTFADSSGNVGIGTSNPQRKLHVQDGDIRIESTFPRLYLTDTDNNSDYSIINNNGKFSIYDDTNATYRMVIDSSGNLLVGKTSDAFNTVGVQLLPTGRVYATATSTAPMYSNRKSTDGSIMDFAKDGTTVGSIGADSGYLTVGKGDTGLLFQDGGNAIQPRSISGLANSDAAIDLGVAGGRFKDLYRSGSTYSTSDRNKKQDIRDLTDAEARVAVVAKGSLKAFRYIDTVEAKGADANIHFGIIAQDLKAAFEAEGLNADNYQVLKTSTYTDDDGVEQTTYSVCYENLLAFIISAI